MVSYISAGNPSQVTDYTSSAPDGICAKKIFEKREPPTVARTPDVHAGAGGACIGYGQAKSTRTNMTDTTEGLQGLVIDGVR